MIELEIQVLSDRREGLVAELGQVVVANHYSLLRQRLTLDGRGARLCMLVRGPPEQRLALEEMLGTHSRVVSFEAALCGEPTAIAFASSRGALQDRVAPVQTVMPDVAHVEQVLPELMHDFPRIYPWLTKLQESVSGSLREPSLLLAGRRVGIAIYKRDYASGPPLSLGEAIKRIGVPALCSLAQIEQRGVHVHIFASLLCAEPGRSGCVFYGGYLEGVLGAAVTGKHVHVRHLSCRSSGAAHCSLEISH
ncbi:V4R domain-containing protein [Dyella monticola]|nr:V4R domain-containing protein [Dyella monticola]